MKTLLILTFSFLFSISILNAQETDKITAEKAITNYFELPRETIYLHLNKSTYVSGENIWFKGYVHEQKEGKPFTETTNVYVNIYNAKGNLIQEGLFRSTNGNIQGNIPVTKDFTSGDYFIKASTNWMKNFKEDQTYVQKIQIINKKIVIPKINEVEYDLQLFAEGGHLVTGVESSIAIKLTNQNGLGETFKQGVLIDGDGKVLLDFKGNTFGMARFFFVPKTSGNYQVKIILENGEEITTPIVKAANKGVVLNVHNHNPKQVLLALRTNKETLKDIKRKEYKLLIHKDGASKTTIVSFENENLETLIPLNRKDLYKGVNIVTLFDENETPLVERLFFNNYDIDFPETNISLSEIKGDSIKVSVKVKSRISDTKNLSISVLPENTRIYNHPDNIFSNFLLTPYVKGYIENPAYFFRSTTRKKENDLDLLLLTQGWSRYDWNNVFNESPKQQYEFETGLTLIGSFKEQRLNKFKILHVLSSKNNEATFLEIQEPNFEIPYLFPEKDEEIKLTLIKKNGQSDVPKVTASFNSKKFSDKLGSFHLNKPSNYYELLPNSDYELSDDIIFLDEVELTQSVKKSRRPTFNSLNNVKVTAEVAQDFPQFSNLIRSRGYSVREGPGSFIIRSNRGRSIGGGSQTPLIIINDALVGGDPDSGNLYDILGELQTADIERIEIIRNGVGYGSRGSNGVIKIWTRKTPLDISGGSATPPFIVDVKNTFHPYKKFYTPKYNYRDPIYEYTGVIHWESELITNKDGVVSFKIPNTGIKNISFYIEGMGEEGSLISTKKSIHLVKQKAK